MSSKKDFLHLQKANTKNEMTLMNKLRKDNALKGKSLIGEYKNAFRSIKKRLIEDVQPGSDRENALSDIMDLLQSASIEGKRIPEIFPDGTDIFCDDLLEAMPIYTSESKHSMKTKKNILALFLSFLLVAVIASFAIWYFGIWGIHTKGISYFAGNEKFTYSGIPVDGEFSVLIDLSDPGSNIGKVLYDAEGCSIVVSHTALVSVVMENIPEMALFSYPAQTTKRSLRKIT
jgi:DNA-binding ferritin-like protein (Dps family)